MDDQQLLRMALEEDLSSALASSKGDAMSTCGHASLMGLAAGELGH